MNIRGSQVQYGPQVQTNKGSQGAHLAVVTECGPDSETS